MVYQGAKKYADNIRINVQLPFKPKGSIIDANRSGETCVGDVNSLVLIAKQTPVAQTGLGSRIRYLLLQLNGFKPPGNASLPSDKTSLNGY